MFTGHNKNRRFLIKSPSIKDIFPYFSEKEEKVTTSDRQQQYFSTSETVHYSM